MTHTGGVSAPVGTRVRAPDESMSLLNEVVRGSGDGYAEAAAARDGARRGRVAAIVVSLLMVAVGLTLSTALLAARQTVPEAQRTDDRLRSEVDRRTRDTDAQARALDALTEQIAAARTSVSGQAGLTTLEQVVGAAVSRGPGFVVTVDDAPARKPTVTSGGAEPAQVDDGRVRDRELQAIVNALWAAGAEGVAVNGQRLTPLAAIRSAGDAILVDYRPLSPPYRVMALGDPTTLESRFTASSVARQFRTYASVLGIGFSSATAESLTLPAGSGIVLRHAQPLEAPP